MRLAFPVIFSFVYRQIKLQIVLGLGTNIRFFNDGKLILIIFNKLLDLHASNAELYNPWKKI